MISDTGNWNCKDVLVDLEFDYCAPTQIISLDCMVIVDDAWYDASGGICRLKHVPGVCQLCAWPAFRPVGLLETEDEYR